MHFKIPPRNTSYSTILLAPIPCPIVHRAIFMKQKADQVHVSQILGGLLQQHNPLASLRAAPWHLSSLRAHQTPPTLLTRHSLPDRPPVARLPRPARFLHLRYPKLILTSSPNTALLCFRRTFLLSFCNADFVLHARKMV